jgi:hypothetical protein
MCMANYGNNMRRKGNSSTHKHEYMCEVLDRRPLRPPPSPPLPLRTSELGVLYRPPSIVRIGKSRTALIGVLGSFLGNTYRDWDVFVYAYKYFCMLYYCLAECVFLLISICSLVLQLWMCAYVVLQSTFSVPKGHNY